MSKEKTEYELRIKCGGDIRAYGTLICESEEKAKVTDDYKKIQGIAESCKYKKSVTNRCCEVQLVSTHSEEYFNDLETPCGSSMVKAISKQSEQAHHETSLVIVCCFALLGVALIASMLAENFEDVFVYSSIFLTWIVFSFNILSKHFGNIVDKAKTICSFGLMILAFFKMGAFSGFL